jgi:hypothetical protein
LKNYGAADEIGERHGSDRDTISQPTEKENNTGTIVMPHATEYGTEFADSTVTPRLSLSIGVTIR